MRVVVFGASGMVGSGVVQECLVDARISAVLVVGRTTCGITHPRLEELLRPDLFDISALAPQLTGLDACYFCLGVTSAGRSEVDYAHLTYDLTLAIAHVLARTSPGLTFCYVSGAGTDSTERGRTMWARVKGRTENALLALPFKAAYLFRPAFIQPMRGERTKTPAYQFLYDLARPIYPLIHWLAPSLSTTTVNVGRAMIAVAASGSPGHVLSSTDINRLAAVGPRPA